MAHLKAPSRGAEVEVMAAKKKSASEPAVRKSVLVMGGAAVGAALFGFILFNFVLGGGGGGGGDQATELATLNNASIRSPRPRRSLGATGP